MSMYGMLFGDGSRGHVLLLSLGFAKVGDVGRYRDAWLEKGDDGETRIAIYTRNGGGNREEYESVFEALRKHPLYLFDLDDDFDFTYATIYFSLPEELADAVKKFEIPDTVDMSKVWQDAIDVLRTEPT